MTSARRENCSAPTGRPCCSWSRRPQPSLRSALRLLRCRLHSAPSLIRPSRLVSQSIQIKLPISSRCQTELAMSPATFDEKTCLISPGRGLGQVLASRRLRVGPQDDRRIHGAEQGIRAQRRKSGEYPERSWWRKRTARCGGLRTESDRPLIRGHLEAAIGDVPVKRSAVLIAGRVDSRCSGHDRAGPTTVRATCPGSRRPWPAAPMGRRMPCSRGGSGRRRPACE